MSSQADYKAAELENEIRKLKLQLLKEELSDKLIILNNYLDNKNEISQTSNSTQVGKELNDETRFESILFANVSGEFLV